MLRGALAILFAPTVLGCSVETTKFGPPEALRQVREPDGGYVIPGVDASTERVCPPGTPPPDNGCTVQWARDLYEPLVRTKWGCTAANCHGFSPPRIADGDAKIARRELTQAITAGKPYIDSCSRNPNASSILCNLTVEGPPVAKCGRPMPETRAPVTPADLQTLTTWLACGAPDN